MQTREGEGWRGGQVPPEGRERGFLVLKLLGSDRRTDTLFVCPPAWTPVVQVGLEKTGNSPDTEGVSAAAWQTSFKSPSPGPRPTAGSNYSQQAGETQETPPQLSGGGTVRPPSASWGPRPLFPPATWILSGRGLLRSLSSSTTGGNLPARFLTQPVLQEAP